MNSHGCVFKTVQLLVVQQSSKWWLVVKACMWVRFYVRSGRLKIAYIILKIGHQNLCSNHTNRYCYLSRRKNSFKFSYVQSSIDIHTLCYMTKHLSNYVVCRNKTWSIWHLYCRHLREWKQGADTTSRAFQTKSSWICNAIHDNC